jgi:hypothetical protein
MAVTDRTGGCQNTVVPVWPQVRASSRYGIRRAPALRRVRRRGRPLPASRRRPGGSRAGGRHRLRPRAGRAHRGPTPGAALPARAVLPARASAAARGPGESERAWPAGSRRLRRPGPQWPPGFRSQSPSLVRDGLVLLVHRHPSRRWYPGCWDLAGGMSRQASRLTRPQPISRYEPSTAEPVPASALSQLRPAKSRVSRLQVRLRLLSAGKIRISSDAPRRVLRRDSMITGEKIAGTEEEQ